MRSKKVLDFDFEGDIDDSVGHYKLQHHAKVI